MKNCDFSQKEYLILCLDLEVDQEKQTNIEAHECFDIIFSIITMNKV